MQADTSEADIAAAMLADIAVAAMWVAASAVVVTPAVALVEAATVVVAVTGKLVLNREKARLLRQAGFFVRVATIFRLWWQWVGANSHGRAQPAGRRYAPLPQDEPGFEPQLT